MNKPYAHAKGSFPLYHTEGRQARTARSITEAILSFGQSFATARLGRGATASNPTIREIHATYPRRRIVCSVQLNPRPRLPQIPIIFHFEMTTTNA